MSTQKTFIVDLFLNGDYVETQTLSQAHPMRKGDSMWVNISKTGKKVFAKVQDTFFCSDDEYHLYLESI